MICLMIHCARAWEGGEREHAASGRLVAVELGCGKIRRDNDGDLILPRMRAWSTVRSRHRPDTLARSARSTLGADGSSR